MMDYKEAMKDAQQIMDEWEADPVRSYSRFMRAKTAVVALVCIALVELLIIVLWVI